MPCSYHPTKFQCSSQSNTTQNQTERIAEARRRVGVPPIITRLDSATVIGFNFFVDCLLTMDYPRQRIILRKGALPPANGKDIFTYGLDNRIPTLGIMIGNERVNILVDTGAAQGVVIPDTIASKLRFIGGLVPGPNLSTFDTPTSRALLGRLSGDITIGIHIIAEPTIHVWNDVPVIGSGLLQDFILTFDQKNRTLKISL